MMTNMKSPKRMFDVIVFISMIIGLNAAASGGPFKCPSPGNFSFPDPDTTNHACRGYYACKTSGEMANPSECPVKTNFDRFSRNCKPVDMVNCNLCNQDVLFPDITSKPHFIQCQNKIPLRYKCKSGDYSWKTETCGVSNTTIKTLNDGTLDMPTDFDTYMLSWRALYPKVNTSKGNAPEDKSIGDDHNPTIDTFVKPQDTIPNCDWSISGYFCIFSLFICAICGIAEIS